MGDLAEDLLPEAAGRGRRFCGRSARDEEAEKGADQGLSHTTPPLPITLR